MLNIDSIQLFLEAYFCNAERSTCVSEYELIEELKKNNLLLIEGESSSLNLFQKHFLVMHSLYHLKQKFEQAGVGKLRITASEISLEPYTAAHSKQVSNDIESQALSDYYLDLNNLKAATESSVNDLLNDFWHKFERYNSVTHKGFELALAMFDLSLPIDEKALNARYRRLLQTHHPDKGGDSDKFIELQEAYATIKAKLQHG